MANDQQVGVGTAPNDGTGDTARAAFQKYNAHAHPIADVSGLQTTLAEKLEATDIAAGTITPAPGALNLGGGEDGQVLTQQADGSLAMEAVAGGAVTPQQFGAVGDGVADDTAALQAFFNHTTTNPVGIALIDGAFKVSAGILVDGSATTHYLFNCIIECTSEAVQDVLTLTNFTFIDVKGQIKINGRSSSIFGPGPVNALRIDGANRTTIDRLIINGFRGWAVYSTSHSGSSSHFIQIGHLTAVNCGVSTDSTRSHKVTASAFSRTGSSGNSTQRTVVTVTPSEVPPELATGGFLVVNGVPHNITAFDATLGTLTVYPWIKTAHAVPGQFELIFGGAFKWGAGVEAKAFVGTIDAVRCGIGAWLGGVGSPIINVFASQFLGIDVALGHDPTSVFGGTAILGAYFEATKTAMVLQVCQSDSGSDGSLITGINSLETAKVMSPRHIMDTDVELEAQYLPVTLLYKNRMHFPWNARNVRKGGNSSFTAMNVENIAKPGPEVLRLDNSPFTLNLLDDVEYRRIKGNHTIAVTIYGRLTQQGSDGGYLGTLNFSAAAGYTINGTVNQSIAVSAKEMPVTYYATLEDDNAGSATVWRVSAIAHAAPS